MSYLNEKGKAIGAAIIYTLFFAVFTLALWFGRLLPGYSWVYGAVLTVIAIPLAIFASGFRPLYILAIFLNSLGSGFVAAFYYTTYSISFGPIEVIVPLAIAVLLLWVLALCYHLFRRPLLHAISALLMVALLVLLAIFWVSTGGAIYSIAFFLAVLLSISAVLLAVTTAGKEENELLRDSAFASFGILILVALIVILLVGGDGCDCDCDFCDCGGPEGKRKKKNIT